VGAVPGLLAGVGLLLVWWSLWQPEPEPEPGPGPASPAHVAAAERLRDVLVRAGVESVSLRALAATCAGLAAIALVVALAVSQSPPVSACFAVIAGWSPLSLVRSRARRRAVAIRELWPEAVDNLASGVRAGLSLPEALAQLGERGPAPLRPAFRAFGRDYRVGGHFAEALEGLQDRLADPVADRICEALRITREVGGSDLGQVLRTLSAFLRQDAATRAELLARQSWTVNGARLAVAAPWAVLATLSTRPESVRPYNSPAGVLVLGAGAALSAVAYRSMVRLARLPDEARVLR